MSTEEERRIMERRRRKEKERGRREAEARMIGGEEVRKGRFSVLGERRGRESERGASFSAMQVLEIPARGRGFPLVTTIQLYNLLLLLL